MLDVIEISKRVESGAEWLDGIKPDWLGNINLTKFRIGGTYTCVLGQVFEGNFFDIVQRQLDDNFKKASRLGFTIDGDHYDDEDYRSDDEWDMLQSAWVGLITVRRSRDGALV